MKILIIANIRNDQGGITTQIRELQSALENEGLEINVISTHGKTLQRVKNILKALFAGRKYDLILGVGCAYLGFIPMAVASVSAFLSGKRVIYNFHDGQVEVFLKKYSGIIKFFIGGNIIITANEFLSNSFRKYGLNTLTINNHLNKIEIKEKQESSYGKIRIMWARNFEKLYHPEIALQAAQNITAKNSNVIFDFYGRGSMLDKMKKEYSDINGINFCGFLERRELLLRYSYYDVFLNTSEFDNFPMSIVEAGMNGLIAVSSKAKGITYLYSEEEIIYYNNSKDLENLLKNIISYPQKYILYSTKLRDKVCTFNWDNVKEKWLKVIYE